MGYLTGIVKHLKPISDTSLLYTDSSVCGVPKRIMSPLPCSVLVIGTKSDWMIRTILLRASSVKLLRSTSISSATNRVARDPVICPVIPLAATLYDCDNEPPATSNWSAMSRRVAPDSRLPSNNHWTISIDSKIPLVWATNSLALEPVADTTSIFSSLGLRIRRHIAYADVM